MALSSDIKDREYNKFTTDESGNTAVNVKLNQDIQLGSVEIKDATTDTRAVVKTDGTNNALVVTQNSQPLPSGASTSALQTTGNSSLSSIDGKITACNTTALSTSSNQTSGSQKTQIVDASGNVINAEEGHAGEYALRTHITQNIQLSAGNTSTADINYNSTFTGTGEETYGFSMIQIFFYSNQRCTVYVDQGSASDTFELTDEFTTHQNIAFTTTITSVAPFFRIRIKNISVNGAKATGVKLFTGMTPILQTLPRTLSARNNLKCDIEEINGRFNTAVTVSPMGALKTSESVKLVGAIFVGTTIDTNFWTVQTPTGTGTASQAYGTLTLATGTTANSSQIVNSVRMGRYTAANPNFYIANIRIPTQTTASASHKTTIRFGAFDTSDGYFFELNQTNPATTPTLSVVCRKTDGTGTNDTAVASGNFNGDYNNYYTIDTNCHTYEIYWTNKNVYFCIDDVLIHTVTGSTTALVATPTLKIGLSIENSGGNTANNSFAVRSSSINRLGPINTEATSKNLVTANTTYVLKYGAGRIHRIILGSTGGTSVAVYDGLDTAGTLLATLTTGAIGSIECGFPFSVGLTIRNVGTGTFATTVVYE